MTTKQLRKSKGHVGWTVMNGSLAEVFARDDVLYRADAYNPLDIWGYRQGARQWWLRYKDPMIQKQWKPLIRKTPQAALRDLK